jgi:hypothetical protein
MFPHQPTHVQSIQIQQLHTFSGDIINLKDEISYAQLHYHILCLLESGINSSPAIMQAVCLSLRGTASDIVISLCKNTTPDSLIEKLDMVFRNELSVDLLEKQFRNAEQMPKMAS